MDEIPTLRTLTLKLIKSEDENNNIIRKLKNRGIRSFFVLFLNKLFFLNMIWINAIIVILKTQLPTICPRDISGDFTIEAADMPVNNSGKDVTMEINTTPMNALPHPFFSAIISALFGIS